MCLLWAVTFESIDLGTSVLACSIFSEYVVHICISDHQFKVTVIGAKSVCAVHIVTLNALST